MLEYIYLYIYIYISLFTILEKIADIWRLISSTICQELKHKSFKMVLEQTYSTNSYAADYQDSKSPYKAMQMMGNTNNAGQMKGKKKNHNNSNGNNNQQKDVWGPVLKNRQNFVDMHLY